MDIDTKSRETVLKNCNNADDLWRWIRLHTGLRMPTCAICPGHDAPFEYIRRAYFEPARDLVIWAPRGGGKTRLGALATLLDLLHKPGCAVRILGGSFEQSLRMWEHLVPDVERLGALSRKRLGRRVQLENGSCAAVLAQSQRAVRGLRVQKLRCDEVELFEPSVWEAAQLVTKSKSEDVTKISGAVEAISTLHTPFGLMNRIVESAAANGTLVIKWCLLEVLERCPAERACSTCPLWEECRGVAKTKCDGFLSIDDAIAMKKRVSRETWKCEMLCRRPSVRGCVFPSFDRAVHVREESDEATKRRSDEEKERKVSLAIDFGFANPFVCLWIVTGADGVAHVIDEYVQTARSVNEHIEEIRGREWPAAKVVACDPAGAGRNEQTAQSNVTLLRKAGFSVRHRSSRIVEGIEMIRAALRPASGEPKLFVHPRCSRLIKALVAYRYGEGSEQPIKDGEHDHLIDALRYWFVNRRGDGAPLRKY